jgi:hypothetical protein
MSKFVAFVLCVVLSQAARARESGDLGSRLDEAALGAGLGQFRGAVRAARDGEVLPARG